MALDSLFCYCRFRLQPSLDIRILDDGGALVLNRATLATTFINADGLRLLLHIQAEVSGVRFDEVPADVLDSSAIEDLATFLVDAELVVPC